MPLNEANLISKSQAVASDAAALAAMTIEQLAQQVVESTSLGITTTELTAEVDSRLQGATLTAKERYFLASMAAALREKQQASAIREFDAATAIYDSSVVGTPVGTLQAADGFQNYGVSNSKTVGATGVLVNVSGLCVIHSLALQTYGHTYHNTAYSYGVRFTLYSGTTLIGTVTCSKSGDDTKRYVELLAGQGSAFAAFVGSGVAVRDFKIEYEVLSYANLSTVGLYGKVQMEVI